MRRKKLMRKIRLEELALRGEAFCLKHKIYLDIETIRLKKCYLGNHGRSYCNYVTSDYYGDKK